MELLAISDDVWKALMTTMVTLVGLILAYMQHRTEKAVKKGADDAAEKVEEVKEVLAIATEEAAGKLSDIARTGEKVHVLVNSNMGLQLKVSAVALRRVAELTNNDEDIAAAVLAEKSLHEHETKQQIVDRKEG